MDSQPLTPGRRLWSGKPDHVGSTYGDMQQLYAPLTMSTAPSPFRAYSPQNSPMSAWSKDGQLHSLFKTDDGRHSFMRLATLVPQAQVPMQQSQKSLSKKNSVRSVVEVEPECEESPTNTRCVMKGFDDYPLNASVANNDLSSTRKSISCSGVESHQAAARVQEAQRGMCVLPCSIKENNWHSSAIVDYKTPMSPMPAAIQQNMHTMAIQACRSWGVFDDDDSMSPISPRSTNSSPMHRTIRGRGSVKSLRSPLLSSLSTSPSSCWETYQVETLPPEELSLRLPLPKWSSKVRVSTSIMLSRDYKEGSKTELDSDTLIWIHYSENPEAMPLPPFTTVRKLRAHLARMHNRFIPQVCLFDYDTLTRIPAAAMNLPPPRDVIVQLWNSNPLPFAPTFYEHAYAEDILTARELIHDCRKLSADTTKDLSGALWYYTKHSADATVPMNGVELLLENNADANTGNFESTPLYNAILSGRKDMALRLMDAKADVRKANREGMKLRPLQGASSQGSLELVRLLLSKGALADEPSCSDEGYSAIHCAVHSGIGGIVSLLVKHGASVERSAANGDTPLLLAIQHRQVAVCKELIASKANVNRMLRGKSMIHWAAEVNDMETIETLVNHGAAINAVTEKEMLTPIHIITQRASMNPRDSRSACALKYLLTCRADVNRPDQMQETPLFSAVKRDCPALVRELIRAKADVHRRNRLGQAAIEYATSIADVQGSATQSECARLLIEAGAQSHLR